VGRSQVTDLASRLCPILVELSVEALSEPWRMNKVFINRRSERRAAS
jgi:hypothetical protein